MIVRDRMRNALSLISRERGERVEGREKGRGWMIQKETRRASIEAVLGEGSIERSTE